MTALTVPTPDGVRASVAKVVGIIISLIGAARMVGALTGAFHIPLGFEDTVQGVGSQLGDVLSSIMTMLNGLGIWAIRRAIK